MNKKIIKIYLCGLTLMFMLAVMLGGCAKCINTETSTVQVKVTNKSGRFNERR